METLENSNITEINSYITHVFGTIGELENCFEIILCLTDESNKLTESSLGAQTSTNTGNLIINNITITQYNKVKRNKLSEDFLYSKSELGNGFNTIIYLDQSERNIGYTEFLNIQGLIPEFIRIKLKFSASINIGESIRTNNKLVILQEELDEKVKKLFNNKNYGFINFKDIKKDLEKSIDDIYPRYTKHLTELSRGENLSILLNQGICTPLGLRKLNLVKEMTIAEDLTNHQLGYYRGEIVLYSWKQNTDGTWEYSVHSMSSKDKFGNPICYTKTSRGTKFIAVDKNLGAIKNIRYFSGKFISVLLSPTSGGNDFLGVYNLETENWVELDLVNHVMDLWGINSRIIELPKAKELSINSALAFCPDIINTHFDIKNYNYNIDIIKKVGSWYVLRQERIWENKGVVNNKVHSFKLYTNFNKTIVLSDTDDNTKDSEPIIINDNILALRTTSGDLDYYTYFVGDGWLYSENALLSIYKGMNNISESSLEMIDGIFQFKKRLNLEGLPIQNNKDYYGDKLLVDHIGSNFLNSYLFKFRRSLCPPKQEVPTIIGSINGLIYYKTENNKIKLL